MEKNFTSDEIKLIEQPENDLEISLLRIVKDKLNDTRSDNAKEQKNLNACESSSNKRNCSTKYSFGENHMIGRRNV